MQLILEFISRLLEYTGAVMIAFTALRVHHRFLNEHKVDDNVFDTMNKEQKIGWAGVVLLTTGFILDIIKFFA